MAVLGSYEYDNDARLQDLPIGRSRLPDSIFDAADCSMKVASPGWRGEPRRGIRRAGQALITCDKHTNTATGVNVEIEVRRGSATPCFALAGYTSDSVKPTAILSGATLHMWNWENLKKIINDG